MDGDGILRDIPMPPLERRDRRTRARKVVRTWAEWSGEDRLRLAQPMFDLVAALFRESSSRADEITALTLLTTVLERTHAATPSPPDPTRVDLLDRLGRQEAESRALGAWTLRHFCPPASLGRTEVADLEALSSWMRCGGLAGLRAAAAQAMDVVADNGVGEVARAARAELEAAAAAARPTDFAELTRLLEERSPPNECVGIQGPG